MVLNSSSKYNKLIDNNTISIKIQNFIKQPQQQQQQQQQLQQQPPQPQQQSQQQPQQQQQRRPRSLSF